MKRLSLFLAPRKCPNCFPSCWQDVYTGRWPPNCLLFHSYVPTEVQYPVSRTIAFGLRGFHPPMKVQKTLVYLPYLQLPILVAISLSCPLTSLLANLFIEQTTCSSFGFLGQLVYIFDALVNHTLPPVPAFSYSSATIDLLRCTSPSASNHD